VQIGDGFLFSTRELRAHLGLPAASPSIEIIDAPAPASY
jgi:hypothetical protein